MATHGVLGGGSGTGMTGSPNTIPASTPYGNWVDPATSMPANRPIGNDGTVNTPPPASTPIDPATGIDPSYGSAYAYLSDILGQYGLSTLVPWVKQQLVSGESADLIANVLIRQTPEFQARFPAIALREKAGLPALSPGDYINYEKQTAETLRLSGLHPDFLKANDITNLLANDVSSAELNDRLQRGFSAVQSAPPEVRAEFERFFGAGQGDPALASYFLDPDKAEPLLLNQVQAAQYGSQAQGQGYDIGSGTALQLAQSNQISPYRFASGLQQLGQERSLLGQTVGEAGRIQPLTSDTAVLGAMGLDPASSQLLDAILQGRQASFAGNNAVAETSDKGVRGVGQVNY